MQSHKFKLLPDTSIQLGGMSKSAFQSSSAVVAAFSFAVAISVSIVVPTVSILVGSVPIVVGSVSGLLSALCSIYVYVSREMSITYNRLEQRSTKVI